MSEYLFRGTLLKELSPQAWEAAWVIDHPEYYRGHLHQIEVIMRIYRRYQINNLIKVIRERRASNGVQRIRRYCGIEGCPRR